MKCPHCTVSFHDKEQLRYIEKDPNGAWGYGVQRCSACERLVIRLFCARHYIPQGQNFSNVHTTYLAWPKVSGRAPLAVVVPAKYADDFREACLVLADSPKASAALSRRSLQHVLREEAKVAPSDLYREIQEILDRGSLPSHIAESLDAVRNIGNFAAHPLKSRSTGEVVPVEPGEADWNLDVLEALFDFFFVLPAKTSARREALNKKLADLGKPPVQ